MIAFVIYKRVQDTLLHEIVFFRAGRRSRCRRATGASQGMIYPQINADLRNLDCHLPKKSALICEICGQRFRRLRPRRKNL
jgi:hypothetical protein